MKKVYAVLAVCFAVTAAPARAGLPGEVVTEPASGFQVWVPLGWRYGKLPDLPVTHLAMSAPDETSQAICILTVENIAITKGATQSQLNESLKVPVGRDFWKGSVFSFISGLTFESDGARMHPTGIMAQEAIVEGSAEVNGAKLRKKLASTIWITPGVTYALSCGAVASQFENFRVSFREVAETFRPKGMANAITAAVNPAPIEKAAAVSLIHGSAGFGSALARATANVVRNAKIQK